MMVADLLTTTYATNGNQQGYWTTAEEPVTALAAALAKRGSGTRQWALSWLGRSGMSEGQASAEIDRAIATGEVVEHEGMLLKGGAKANPTKGRSSMRRPAKAASKGSDLARARAKLAEKRVQGVRKANPTTKRAPKPKAMSLAQMVEHNRRTAAMPGSSKPVRPKGRATEPKVQENPMAKTLTAAQKRALADGRKKLASLRKSGGTAKRRTAPKKRTTGKKKRTLSAKQKAALAKGRAAAAAKRAAAAAPKPATRKPRRAPKKKTSAAKKTSRSRGVPAARKSIARASKALAPRPRPRKPGVKPPKSIHGGAYTNKKGQTIVVRRTYNKRNPVVEFKQIALAGGGLALGWIAAEFADRYVATRAPKGENTKPLYGEDAKKAIQKPADGTRLMVSGGGTLGFGLGAFMLRDKAPDVAYALGGMGAGFGVKFFSQLIGDVVLPAIFKVDKTKEGWADSYSNRLFPDKQKVEDTPAPALPDGAVTGRVGGWGNWGPGRRVFYPGAMGAPRQQQNPYPFVEAPARQPHVGPVATGAVAGSCGGAALSADLNDVFLSPKSGGCSSCGCGKVPQYNDPCPTCAQPPQPVQPPYQPPRYEPSDPGVPSFEQPPYDPGFRKDLSIVEQPPVRFEYAEPDPRRVPIQPYIPSNGRDGGNGNGSADTDMLVRSAMAAGLTGEPQAQHEPQIRESQPEPQSQGVSGTAAVMSMVGRRRRAR
jgi:colicin import membrane protein